MTTTCSSETTVGNELIVITQGDCVPSPPCGCSLLLGFWFGEDSCDSVNQQVARLGLRPIGRPSAFEGWWYRGQVEHEYRHSVKIAECQDYSAAVTQRDETDSAAIRELTRETYIDLLTALRESTHRNIIRMWNYFGQINQGEGNLERYRQFSIGRAEAFEHLGFEDEFSPPATAVGTVSGNSFSVVALASDNQFQRLENPRQLSAYDYPSQYGPRSPKFSRGGVVSISDHEMLLISGTASIVGHESMHPHRAAPQTEETFRNIESLVTTSGLGHIAGRASALRVYVRNQADYEAVTTMVDKFMDSSKSGRIYLQGDICRKELMVEIDGVLM
jgi:chorismate lyase/3-hydroxybenzoate synthase